MNSILHLPSVSGGKDSTATLLMAREEHGDQIHGVFADTGNEHQITYAYIDYLEQATGIPIKRLRRDFTEEWWARRHSIETKWPRKGVPEAVIRRVLAVFDRGPTGNPFLDLCIIKSRFPTRTMPFCTKELKVVPLTEYAMNHIDATGQAVWSWQGVRIDESVGRRNRFQGSGACVKHFEDVGGGFYVNRPILRWTVDDVFDVHRYYGIAPNSLYLRGRKRVGCFCVNSDKEEVPQWALRDPEHIDRIDEWEQIVSEASKLGGSTFFAMKDIDAKDAAAQGNIWQVVKWANTTHGGHQFDLIHSFEAPDSCSSAYGLCDTAT